VPQSALNPMLQSTPTKAKTASRERFRTVSGRNQLVGKIVEVNETIVEDPSIVNSDAEGEGWFFRLELDDPDTFETLMDQDAYDEFLETL